MKTEIKEKLKIANDRLLLYLNAEKAILKGQSYEIEGLKLTRANLKDVVNTIDSLKKEIAVLEAKLNRRTRVKLVNLRW